jgi:uncharacterized protein with PIN domain
VTLLDAYALVALVADEPAADEVEELLRAGTCRVVVVNLAEAIDISGRVHGLDSEAIRAAIEPLFVSEVLDAVASDEPTAWLAAETRSRHYGKERRVSMADCFLLAHAIAASEPVATSDPPVASVARERGLQVIPLPDSSGARP